MQDALRSSRSTGRSRCGASPRPAGPAPDRAALRDAALRYLARFAATEAGLLRVLNRRIDRWARRAEAEGGVADPAASRAAARMVMTELVAAGAVNDAAFAESRARSLSRAGKSRRAIGVHLAARGVAEPLARQSLPDDPDAELAAALLQARRRRIGPYAAAPDPDPNRARRDLARLVRAGFAVDTAARAMRMERDAAEDAINRFRQAQG